MTRRQEARRRIRAAVTALPAALPVREIRIRRRQRALADPNWLGLGAGDEPWAAARARAKGGPRVLIATAVGLHMPSTILESALAVGLTWRGAEVDALLCDGALPACFACEWDWFPGRASLDRLGPQRHLCPTCIPSGRRPYDQLGLAVHTFGALIEPDEARSVRSLVDGMDTSELDDYECDGVPVGEHARAGALRFLARGDFDGVSDGSAIRRRYLAAAILTVSAVARLLRSSPYDVVVASHGIYVPQGVVVDAARRRGVRTVTWEPAYRERTVIFSHGGSYHHTLTDEPVETWESMPWDDELDRDLTSYLDGRRTGEGDQISFTRHATVVDPEQIAHELRLDRNRPTIGLLTNVIWDAQLHYPANVFASMMDWLVESIEHLGRRTDLQVLVRVHPAELYGFLRSRQLVIDELATRLGALPANTIVVGPQSPISTVEAMRSCDTVIVYGTKTGVELAARGIPVVVAGEAWIRNKGIGIEPADAAEYFRILDGLPGGVRLDAATTERARRYAFHFFFRRMIPLEELEPREGHPPYRLAINRIEQLGSDSSPGYDLICRGILDGSPFVYPAERDRRRPLASR